MFKNLSTEALGLRGTESETIEMALSHGFRGIDLDLIDFGRQVESRGLAASRRLLDSARLKLGSFRLPVDLEGDDAAFRRDLDRLSALARLAADVGCRRAVTSIEPASDERPYHQNFEFHRQRLAEVASLLEPLGIRLGAGWRSARPHREGKNYEFISQLDPLLMLLEMSARPNLGVVLDVWELHVSGGGVDDVRRLRGEQVVAVRLADFPTDADRETCGDECRVLPGETGVIDIPAMLSILAEKGYDGPVTPFPDRRRLQGLRRDEIAKRAGEAMDQLWKAAGLSPAGKLSKASS